MITLNDSRWNEMQDAYGSASYIPTLLQQVIADKSAQHDSQSGPWFDLWSRLCHQGSIYTASYAVVPILVDIAKNTDGPIAMDFILMPVSIELSRNKSETPSIPPYIKDEYFKAINDLGIIASRYIQVENDESLKKAATAAHLVSEGKYDQAEKIIDA